MNHCDLQHDKNGFFFCSSLSGFVTVIDLARGLIVTCMLAISPAIAVNMASKPFPVFAEISNLILSGTSHILAISSAILLIVSDSSRSDLLPTSTLIMFKLLSPMRVEWKFVTQSVRFVTESMLSTAYTSTTTLACRK